MDETTETALQSSSDVTTKTAPPENRTTETALQSSSDVTTKTAPPEDRTTETAVLSSSGGTTETAPTEDRTTEAALQSSSDVTTKTAPAEDRTTETAVPSSSDVTTETAPTEDRTIDTAVPSSSDVTTKTAPPEDRTTEAAVPSSSSGTTKRAPAEDRTTETALQSSLAGTTKTASTEDRTTEAAVSSSSGETTKTAPTEDRTTEAAVSSSSGGFIETAPAEDRTTETALQSSSDVTTKTAPTEDRTTDTAFQSSSDVTTKTALTQDRTTETALQFSSDVTIKTAPTKDRTVVAVESVDDPHKEQSQSQRIKQQIQNVIPVKEPDVDYEENKKKKPLYGPDSLLRIYAVRGNIVTPTLITKNLPDQFSTLPIYGRPPNKSETPQFFKNKIREFVGYDLNDEEFDKLSKYCSPDHLKTGNEIQMSTIHPTIGPFPAFDKVNEKKVLDKAAEMSDDMKLNIHKRLQLRLEKDSGNMYCRKFKYRGIRFTPLSSSTEEKSPIVQIGKPLEPGKELVFRIRIYRPYNTGQRQLRFKSARHSLLSHDVVMLGRQSLSLLRDRFVCANDLGLRLDQADDPDQPPHTHAKTLFPSGFLFINNVFYVDSRAGCVDHSAVIRSWAAKRGFGLFDKKDLVTTKLEDVPLKLGHPEVYVHQGNCEHIFTVSEIRLLGPKDPPLTSQYPLHSQHAQHQTVYCTTCAEFGAKWIVVGCDRVPFDPAFFCDTCFKLYLYKDGQKIGDFKAYSYRGNELNVFKPQG